MKYALWIWSLLWVGVAAVAFFAFPAWDTDDTGCRDTFICWSGTESFFVILSLAFGAWLVGLVVIFGAREIVDAFLRGIRASG